MCVLDYELEATDQKRGRWILVEDKCDFESWRFEDSRQTLMRMYSERRRRGRRGGCFDWRLSVVL